MVAIYTLVAVATAVGFSGGAASMLRHDDQVYGNQLNAREATVTVTVTETLCGSLGYGSYTIPITPMTSIGTATETSIGTGSMPPASATPGTSTFTSIMTSVTPTVTTSMLSTPTATEESTSSVPTGPDTSTTPVLTATTSDTSKISTTSTVTSESITVPATTTTHGSTTTTHLSVTTSVATSTPPAVNGAGPVIPGSSLFALAALAMLF